MIAASFALLPVALLAGDGSAWGLARPAQRAAGHPPLRAVRERTDGPSLNGALAGTGALLGAYALLVSIGLLTLAATRQGSPRVEAIPVALPFREPYVTSTGTLDAREMVLLRLGTTGGDSGWGDAVPLSLRGGDPARCRCSPTWSGPAPPA